MTFGKRAKKLHDFSTTSISIGREPAYVAALIRYITSFRMFCYTSGNTSRSAGLPATKSANGRELCRLRFNYLRIPEASGGHSAEVYPFI